MELIRKLLGTDRFKIKTYLKINGALGVLLLVGAFISWNAEGSGSPLLSESLWVEIVAGVVLAGGSLALPGHSARTRAVLVAQGTVICLLVAFYTYFMSHAYRLLVSGEVKMSMSHATGILALAAAYGMKQVISFNGSFRASSSALVKNLPVLLFILGACCDAFVVFLMYKAMGSWPRF